MVTFSSKT